ncbi:MAG: SPOR domain-containing protein [Pseudomonadota bacterium]
MPEYMRSRHNEESESFFCRFTFGQFFALLVLEVFTLFFVFYLGARYGRGLLGLDRAPAVAVESGSAETSRVVTTADPEVAKMAKDLIAKAETPELKDRIQNMINQAQGPRSSSQMPEVVKVERESTQEKPVEAPMDSVPEQPEVAATSEPTAENTSRDAGVIRIKSSESARYSVQVGSYPDMAEASSVVERWKTKGYPAYLMIADIPDRGRWYRVRIGGFESRAEASKYMDKFTSRESVEALVVFNEQ